MTDRPPTTLAVITVVKDHPTGLARTAGSLQTLPGISLFWYVADGGSAQGIPTDHPGPQPHWADSRPDGGVYAGMNRALQRVQADALANAVLFLNAGDEIANPAELAKLVSMAARGEMVYGDACESDDDGRDWYWPARPAQWLAWGMPAHHQAILYPRAALAGLCFDPCYPVGADYALTLQVARLVPVKRIPILVCRFEGGGLSHQQAAQGRLDQYRIRRQLLGWPASLAGGVYLVQQCRWWLRHYCWPLFRRLRRLSPIADG